MNQPDQHSRRNRTVAAACAAFVFAMVGAAYAAVPLYQMFCEVTGYGGTTRRVEAAKDGTIDRMMTIRFDANVASDLPWEFRPVERSTEVQVGAVQTIYYEVTNLSGRPTAGIAAFNVTPLQAGSYFSKINCFCFDEQVMAPNETREMAVTFFVDPAIADDINTASLSTITLSYTFFSAGVPEGPLAAASTDDAARPNM
jgi:cytochrome c oxidase assembly protein subunit 11